MSKIFLGPIKNPTWKDFVIRVGGVFVVFIVAIMIAKVFFPGSESVAIIIVSSVGFVTLAVQTLRHYLAAKKTKHRSKKR